MKKKGYLVILVTAAVWHLISFKHLFGEAFLALLLLVQSVGIKASTKLMISEGTSHYLEHFNSFTNIISGLLRVF